MKFSKGHNTVNDVDGVYFFLCKLSYDALYLYEISWINLQPVLSCGADAKCYLLNFDFLGVSLTLVGYC